MNIINLDNLSVSLLLVTQKSFYKFTQSNYKLIDSNKNVLRKQFIERGLAEIYYNGTSVASLNLDILRQDLTKGQINLCACFEDYKIYQEKIDHEEDEQINRTPIAVITDMVIKENVFGESTKEYCIAAVLNELNYRGLFCEAIMDYEKNRINIYKKNILESKKNKNSYIK